MRRVAFASTMFGYSWGGSEELWAAAARRAVEAGHRVTAFVYVSPAPVPRVAELEALGVTVVRRPRRFDYWPGPVGRVLRRANTLSRQLARYDGDVVVVSQGGTYDVATQEPLAAGLAGSNRPFVLVCQANSEFVPSDALRDRAAKVFARSRRVVFVAHGNRLAAERQLAARLPNAVVVQNPVNLPGYDPIPWPGGPCRLACVARLDSGVKGQDVLFESLSGPAWADRDWSLTLFGEGPHRRYLEALAGTYGIGGRVRFAGQVADVAGIWREHHLLVLPSRSEGTPLALVEALIAGRPAVVTDVGDSARWVTEGVTGFVAEAPTPASLGRALERAWARRADWAGMGGAAHAHAAATVDRDPGSTLLDVALDGVLQP
jgi:glycosyltransferase involved in cell wall biosynthesis